MKKLIILAMIGMITLSCSNESVTGPNQEPVQKSTVNKSAARGEDTSKEEQEAIDAIKMDTAGKYVGTTGTTIHCHTDYLSDVGHSCVSSGGYLFNVSWTSYYSYPSGESGYYPDGPVYTATQVSSCNCR